MWRELAEDLRRYPGKGWQPLKCAIASPGFWAVATYRVHRAVYDLPAPLGLVAKVAIKPAALAVTLLTGVELPPAARIGPGLYVGHHGGIIVSGEAVLGARCNLSQGVTIGMAPMASAARRWWGTGSTWRRGPRSSAPSGWATTWPWAPTRWSTATCPRA